MNVAEFFKFLGIAGALTKSQVNTAGGIAGLDQDGKLSVTDFDRLSVYAPDNQPLFTVEGDGGTVSVYNQAGNLVWEVSAEGESNIYDTDDARVVTQALGGSSTFIDGVGGYGAIVDAGLGFKHEVTNGSLAVKVSLEGVEYPFYHTANTLQLLQSKLQSSVALGETPRSVVMTEIGLQQFDPALGEFRPIGTTAIAGDADNLLSLSAAGTAKDSGFRAGGSFSASDDKQLPTSNEISTRIDAQIRAIIGGDQVGSVAAVSSANVNTSSPGITVGGVTLIPGMNVLLTGQTNTVQNGLWTFNGTSLLRDPAISWDDISGNWVYAVSNSTAYRFTGATGGTIDVDPQTWIIDLVATAPDPSLSFVSTVGSASGNATLTRPLRQPAQALSRSGATFPHIVLLAGQTFDGVTHTAGTSNTTIMSPDMFRDAGKSQIVTTTTFAIGSTRNRYRGVVFSTGAAVPLLFQAGTAMRHAFQDCGFITTNRNLMQFAAGTNWIDLINIDATSSIQSSIPLVGGMIYNISSQRTRLSFSGVGGVNTVVNISADCAEGAVRVPSGFAGQILWNGVEFAQQIREVVTNQARLTAILSSTNTADDGFYLIDFAAPSHFAYGGIFGKQSGGGGTEVWWARTPTQAPAIFRLISGASYIQQQTSIGGGTDNSAILALTGVSVGDPTPRGFLAPRLSTEQRMAIASPSNGLQVYDLNFGCEFVYKGTRWKPHDPAFAVDDVLLSAPTPSTGAGVYVQIAGTPPSGVQLNQVFWWTGTAGISPILYQDLPPDIVLGNAVLRKNGGGWVQDRYEAGVNTTIMHGSTTSSLTWVDVPGGTFRIERPGVWDVEYSVAVSNPGANATGFRVIRSSDSSIVDQSMSTEGYIGGVSGLVHVTVQKSFALEVGAANTDYKLQWCVSASTSTILNNYVSQSSIQSASVPNVGESFVRWKKVATFDPVLPVRTFTEPLTITSTGTMPPGKGATRLRDYITAVDDGSGWVNLDLAYAHTSAGTAGVGNGSVFKLPGSLTFDTTFHPLLTTSSDGMQYAQDDFKHIIPAYGALIVNNANREMFFGIAPISANTFVICMAGTADYGLGTLLGTNYSYSRFHFMGGSRFKKG